MSVTFSPAAAASATAERVSSTGGTLSVTRRPGNWDYRFAKSVDFGTVAPGAAAPAIVTIANNPTSVT